LELQKSNILLNKLFNQKETKKSTVVKNTKDISFNILFNQFKDDNKLSLQNLNAKSQNYSVDAFKSNAAITYLYHQYKYIHNLKENLKLTSEIHNTTQTDENQTIKRKNLEPKNEEIKNISIQLNKKTSFLYLYKEFPALSRNKFHLKNIFTFNTYIDLQSFVKAKNVVSTKYNFKPIKDLKNINSLSNQKQSHLLNFFTNIQESKHINNKNKLANKTANLAQNLLNSKEVIAKYVIKKDKLRNILLTFKEIENYKILKSNLKNKVAQPENLNNKTKKINDKKISSDLQNSLIQTYINNMTLIDKNTKNEKILINNINKFISKFYKFSEFEKLDNIKITVFTYRLEKNKILTLNKDSYQKKFKNYKIDELVNNKLNLNQNLQKKTQNLIQADSKKINHEPKHTENNNNNYINNLNFEKNSKEIMFKSEDFTILKDKLSKNTETTVIKSSDKSDSSHNTQISYNNNSSNSDYSWDFEEKLYVTKNETKQKNYHFEQNLNRIINMKINLDNLTLKASLVNNKFNLTIITDSTNIFNMKNEIENIIAETGFKKYKVEVKEKNEKILKKDNYREINVRV
jgi:hypothetical protein